MLPLRELQVGIRDALLGADAAGVHAAIVPGGLTPAARLGVYRHHVLASLTDALRAVYPVVCRLVDDRFFAYAADTFIRRSPPAVRCLSEYGAGFPDFLAAFPACRHLAWLRDVARLEWAMALAADAPDTVSVDVRSLRDVEPDDAPGIVLRLDAAVTYLGSRWPVDDIWRANRRDDATSRVDLASGAVALEVRRAGDEVVMRRLPAGTGAFRRTLAAGQCLDVATAVATAADPTFDLAAELALLLAEHVVTGFTVHPSHRRRIRCDT
jgi:hypothetical protein